MAAVERIPAGRVASYGDIAEYVGSGGPRQVGRVMALYGSSVPWWRVVRADGQPARCHELEALGRLRAEGTPLRGDRVQMSQARMITWD
nr:MGMT family protein [Microlunatus panaciterrae]